MSEKEGKITGKSKVQTAFKMSLPTVVFKNMGNSTHLVRVSLPGW
jgi:hypothetical protein